MSVPSDLTSELTKTAKIQDIIGSPDVAHLIIHHHKVTSSHLLPGLDVQTKESEDHIDITVRLKEETKIEKPVHMCFGMLPKEGVQKLNMDIIIGKNASIDILAHCTFPNGVAIDHIMDAKIVIEQGASYSYFERHIHGDNGGVNVYPTAHIDLKKKSHFYSEFELLKGRAGLIDINYAVDCDEDSILEMLARINAKGDDVVKINEIGNLNGDRSRGVLNSRVACRDNAKAEVKSVITASGSYARGHVDCTEIVQDNASVNAVPIVTVNNPKAHITHEAALGSVDSKQLQTLMAHGLTEEEATDLIIQGLLS